MSTRSSTQKASESENEEWPTVIVNGEEVDAFVIVDDDEACEEMSEGELNAYKDFMAQRTKWKHQEWDSSDDDSPFEKNREEPDSESDMDDDDVVELEEKTFEMVESPGDNVKILERTAKRPSQQDDLECEPLAKRPYPKRGNRRPPDHYKSWGYVTTTDVDMRTLSLKRQEPEDYSLVDDERKMPAKVTLGNERETNLKKDGPTKPMKRASTYKKRTQREKIQKLNARDTYIFQFYYQGLHEYGQKKPGAQDHFKLLKALSSGEKQAEVYNLILLKTDNELHARVYKDLCNMNYQDFWYNARVLAKLAEEAPQGLKN